jgi:hypothetical protein
MVICPIQLGNLIRDILSPLILCYIEKTGFSILQNLEKWWLYQGKQTIGLAVVMITKCKYSARTDLPLNCVAAILNPYRKMQDRKIPKEMAAVRFLKRK